MSDDRSRGAFSVNAGGRDQVYLFDPAAIIMKVLAAYL